MNVQETGDTKSVETAVARLKVAIDFDIVGENIKDIVLFSIEKYEFIGDKEIGEDSREEIYNYALGKLLEHVEQLRKERLRILQGMFELAEKSVAEAIETK